MKGGISKLALRGTQMKAISPSESYVESRLIVKKSLKIIQICHCPGIPGNMPNFGFLLQWKSNKKMYFCE